MPVDHGRYFTSTAVFLSEVSKLSFCLVVVVVVFIRKKAKDSRPWSLQNLWSEILGGDAWKLSIPAGLYTVISSSTVLTLLVSASE
jgi:solute carrier family 35 (UDP-sugar transporter), member A1/2/3